jgi:hypothetical protein
LKAYLLVLASGGTRAVEALAIRIKDIDFSISPTKIHIRKEYTKTKCARDIYISEEATQYLKQWIDWKYGDKGENTKRRHPDDLVFSIYTIKNEPNPTHLYQKILIEFEKLLQVAGLDERKEEGVYKRRKITLHSFRRFVKTVISDQVNQDSYKVRTLSDSIKFYLPRTEGYLEIIRHIAEQYGAMSLIEFDGYFEGKFEPTKYMRVEVHVNNAKEDGLIEFANKIRIMLLEKDVKRVTIRRWMRSNSQ